MSDRRSSNNIYQGVYYLAAGLIYLAVFLRSILIYQGTPYLPAIIGLLLAFLLLFLLDSAFSRRSASWFTIYLILQTILVFLLPFSSNFDEYDFYSILYAILGMQAFQRLDTRRGIGWILLFLCLIGIPYLRFEGLLEGSIRLVLFGSIIVFLSAYSLATRRAQLARSQNQSLMELLETANRQLEAHVDTLKQLGVAHERQRLRRELHDSVTQTIFSMTLTTQSGLLLLERDPSRVGEQLERLNQLAQSALAEMHTLISELRPDHSESSSLVLKIRQHLDARQLPEDLAVSFDVEGEQSLSALEDQGLFRITQEALNNVVKHARATQVCLRLHLTEPVWIEIEDNGQGFDLQQAYKKGQLGLAGMHERAAEIDWSLSIQSTPGAGTRLRVEKKYPAGEKL